MLNVSANEGNATIETPKTVTPKANILIAFLRGICLSILLDFALPLLSASFFNNLHILERASKTHVYINPDCFLQNMKVFLVSSCEYIW